ncbi:MAG TPA: hypothetical protein VHW72_10565, partial [Candidatus Angelobacter sp.]|nr:hypothetical protein [Candidatus Angelobacter sp.]
MSSPSTTPNITLDFSKAQPVAQGDSSQAVSLDFSKAQPTQVSMVGPQGEKQQVPTEQVAAMRQKNFAVTPDTPGVAKAVDYQKGSVNYILPQEADQFHAAGHAIVQPDGSIRYPIIRDKNGVISQDPLEEQKSRQKVYEALNADEKTRNQSFERNEALKAGVNATIATASGVTGASSLASAAELGQAGLAKLGETEAVQLFRSSPKLYAEYLLKNVAAPAAKKAAIEALKHPIRTSFG